MRAGALGYPQVAKAVGPQVGFTDGASVLDRYAELLTMNGGADPEDAEPSEERQYAREMCA